MRNSFVFYSLLEEFCFKIWVKKLVFKILYFLSFKIIFLIVY